MIPFKAGDVVYFYNNPNCLYKIVSMTIKYVTRVEHIDTGTHHNGYWTFETIKKYKSDNKEHLPEWF
jgi:hypothetical protein